MARKDFVDWVRGLAVIAMVVWHTADGWLSPDVRVGQAWASLRFVGGLAAPTFLFLAGTGAALAARPERSSQGSTWGACARGLEILLFGYALRFQTWLIDAAALSHPHLARSFIPIGLGYGALLLSLRSASAGRPHAPRWALLGLLACVVGFAQVPWLAPGRLPRLLQVDVLQAIGATLALFALGERSFGLLQRPRLAIALGMGIAFTTEPLWALLPGVLPVPIAGYLGKFEPAAHMPPASLFPLFPWTAYACFGAAFGTMLRTRRAHAESFVVAAGVLGALIALSTSEALHGVQVAIASQPWSVHPLRVAFRIGLVLVLLLIGWLFCANGRGSALISCGRASLRIYWAHLLVAYGVLGHPWQKRLFMGEWAARLVLLLALMWLLSRVGAVPAVPRKAEATP
ncbi:MAG TPA: heparan-alpha-glucosaminide N-acetyltransferase domain-containing protein [Polyangiales bacterium]